MVVKDRQGPYLYMSLIMILSWHWKSHLLSLVGMNVDYYSSWEAYTTKWLAILCAPKMYTMESLTWFGHFAGFILCSWITLSEFSCGLNGVSVISRISYEMRSGFYRHWSRNESTGVASLGFKKLYFHIMRASVTIQLEYI